jgi:protocatechuate 3,4-dioxygenase alpha subunit
MLRDEPEGQARLVTEATPGPHIVIDGRVLDGTGAPVPDALVEIWQADARGHYGNGMADRDAFCGYGRVATDASGGFRFETVKPGPVAGADGRPQAPHVLVAVFAPGILARYWTRAYFDDEPANATDAVLQGVPPSRRGTLVARTTGAHRYAFTLVLQGKDETVFFVA